MTVVEQLPYCDRNPASGGLDLMPDLPITVISHAPEKSHHRQVMKTPPQREDSTVGAFGSRVEDQDAVACPRLEALGLRLYVQERKNGELCIQIRQDKPMQRHLKSLTIGRFGQGDIVYEPNPEAEQDE
jgi:hypothetical protein